MSIECLQRSPSLPSSSSPVHSTVGGHHPPPSLDTHHYPFQLVAEIAGSTQRSSSRGVSTMTRTDLDGDSVTAAAGTAADNTTTTSITAAATTTSASRPQIPPRPVGGKPVPPPRRSSAVSSSSSALSTTLTSNNDNNKNTTATTTTASPETSEAEAPKHLKNKKPSAEQSSETSPPFTETTGSVSHASTSGCNTPPVIRWGRNFNDLIKDKEGLDLFTKYLRQEAQSEDLVHFYYTCESIKCQENRPHVARLARAILKKFIINGNCSVGKWLSEGVKSKLVQDYKKLNENRANREPENEAGKDANVSNNNNVKFTDEFYMNLFNDAQTEIFNVLSESLYKNFLLNGIYLTHLNEITMNNEQPIVYSEAPNAEATPSPSNDSLFDEANSLESIDSATQLPPSYESLRQGESPYDYGYRNQSGFALSTKPLPTVSEQDETGSAVDLKSDDEVASTMAAADLDGFSSYQQMFPFKEAGTFSGYLASAEDSGIETQVSLVPSERTVSNRNRNHSGKSRSHSPTVNTVGMSSTTTTTITPLGRGVNFQRVLNNHRNELIDEGRIKYQSAKVTMSQEMFHQSYLNSKQQMAQGYPAPHPYHVSSFSVVPPSTRDSEIQSISSNSTSESYALLNYSRDRNHHSKQATANSKSNPNFPPNALRSALNAHAFRHPSQGHQQQQGGASNVPDPTTKPEAFASLLAKKLRGFLHDAATQSQFIHKLREVEKESESAGYNQGLKDALKNKKFNLKPPDDKDDQSILDNHCAQVFDMTPSNSGTPTTAVQPLSQAPVVASGGAAAAGAPAYHHHHHHHQQQQQTGAYPPYRGVPAAVASGPHHFSGPNALNRLQNLSLSSNPSLVNGPNSSHIYLGPNQTAPPPLSHESTDVTVTVSFSDDSCPYKLTLPRQPNVTLAQFKAAIPTKKGKVYLHYFKRKCSPTESVDLNSPFVFEAIDNDAAVLPQYDGKIFAKANLQQ